MEEPDQSRRRGERGYAICTSGRSGSNLFCQYLSSTGVLGHPLEYFNGAGRRMLGFRDYPDEPGQQLECVLTIGATGNGIYGLKLFPEQLDRVARSVRWTQRLPRLHFVLLDRRDLLAQAISWLRAEQTDRWRAGMASRGAEVYDAARIRDLLRRAARDNARWRVFFACNDIAPVIVAYEDLVAEPQACVDRVARLFGLEGRAPIDASKIDLVIQRDALSAEWRARFLAERRNPDELDPL
jgi:trehalose 2-sulfotransferase